MKWFGTHRRRELSVVPYERIRPQGEFAVLIQFVNEHGQVQGETALPAKDRRRVMARDGVQYWAERQHPSGVWVYRSQ